MFRIGTYAFTLTRRQGFSGDSLYGVADESFFTFSCYFNVIDSSPFLSVVHLAEFLTSLPKLAPLSQNEHSKNRPERIILKQSIILVDSGRESLPEVATTLEASGFQVLQCRSTSDLGKLGRKSDRRVVILDLDDALINNRVLKDVKRKRPAMQIIGISRRPFHPELKEAMRSYIYACMSKPMDAEELIYLVKGLFCAP